MKPASVSNTQDQTQVRHLTVKEAAYRLHKSPGAIYSWLRRGRLHAWQPGGPGCMIYIIEASVERAMHFLNSPV